MGKHHFVSLFHNHHFIFSSSDSWRSIFPFSINYKLHIFYTTANHFSKAYCRFLDELPTFQASAVYFRCSLLNCWFYYSFIIILYDFKLSHHQVIIFGCRLESNPRLLRQVLSLCTWGACVPGDQGAPLSQIFNYL